MCERLTLPAALLGLLVWTPALSADGGCGKVNCPRCLYECRLDVTREAETGYGWDVECQAVCVPRFKLPWQTCCAPQCAWVKTVKVLKRREHQCQRCHYKWTAAPRNFERRTSNVERPTTK